MRKSVKKKAILTALFILLAGIMAIASKMALPSEVNVEAFDSLLVKSVGFEAVASAYFLMIYVHNAITVLIFEKRAEMSNLQIGIRFGIVYAAIYFFAMQEPVIKSSPFAAWGLDFVIYQFFGGIGEAIAALLLCLGVSAFAIEKKKRRAKAAAWRKNVPEILLIAVFFTVFRTIFYETGIIHSDVKISPIPVYVWTAVFGIVLGTGYVILKPIFATRQNRLTRIFLNAGLSIGACWILFNSFIGLIFAGAMAELLLRSVLDVAAIFTAALITRRLDKYCK